MEKRNFEQKQPDSEEDSISLTSTIKSVHSENEFFEVEKILAENIDSKSATYLIQWEGYPISRATWEPRKQIRHLRDVMNQWRYRQSLEESGEQKPFDIAAWAAARQKSEDERISRKNRRASKINRLRQAQNFVHDQDISSHSEITKAPDNYCQVRSQGVDNSMSDGPISNEKTYFKDNVLPESSICLNNRKFRPKRKLIVEDDSDDDSTGFPARPPTTRLRRSESPSLSLNQPKTLTSVVVETHSPALKVARNSMIDRPRERTSSSSSSDEPLAQVIRRSRALQASSKATTETTAIPTSKYPSLISQHSNNSNSSESDSPENKSLSSLLKARLANTSGASSEINPADAIKLTSNPRKNTLLQGIPHSGTRPKPLTFSGSLSVSKGELVESRGQSACDVLKITTASPKQPKSGNIYNKEGRLAHQEDHITNKVPNLELDHGLINPLSPELLKPSRPETMPKAPSSIKSQENQLSHQVGESVYPAPDRRANFEFTSAPQPHQFDEELLIGDQEQVILDPKRQASSVSKRYNSTQEHDSGVQVAKDQKRVTANGSICFFWNRHQKQQNKDICRYGSDCRFLHAYVEGCQVAPPPKSFRESNKKIPAATSLSPIKDQNKYVDNSPTLSPSMGLLSQTSQNENPDLPVPTQSKSDLLQPVLTKDASTGIRSVSLDVKKDLSMSLKSTTVTSPAIRDQCGSQNSASEICYSLVNSKFPDVEQDCKIELPDDAQSSFPPLPAVPQESCAKPCSNSSLPKTNSINCQESISEDVCRPPWNPKDPNNAVCYFWHRDGMCLRLNCGFLHSLDNEAPIAPSPKEQRMIKKQASDVCKFWLKNDCIHTASSCRFKHSFRSEKSTKNTQPDEDVEHPKDTTPTKESPQRQNKHSTLIDSNEGPKNVDSSLVSKDLPDLPTIQPLEFDNSDDTETKAIVTFVEHEEKIKLAEEDKENDTTQSPTPNAKFEFEPQNDSTITVTPESQDPQHKFNYHTLQTFEDGKGIIKEVTLGMDNSVPVALNFGDISMATEHSWKRTFTFIYKIHFNHLCLAHDFQNQPEFSGHSILWQGSLNTVDSNDLNATKTIEAIFNELVIRCAGLLATIGDFSILMFPAKREEWRFLDLSQNNCPDIRLCYSVFSYSHSRYPHGATPMGAETTPYPQLLTYKVQNFLIPDLLQDFVLKDEKNPPPCKIFLFFPPTASQMADFMKFCLFSYNLDFKIYGSMTEGSWDIFGQTHLFKQSPDFPEITLPGIVLIHESVVAEIYRLPKLSTVLDKPEIVFWQISEGISRCPPYPSHHTPTNSKLGHITATKLFPHGCAIFLSPSFLAAEPTAALEFIKWFIVERFPNQITPWRLVGAHSLSEYALDVARSKALEATSYENRHSKSPSDKRNQALAERSLSYATCNDRWGLYTELSKLNSQIPEDSDLEDELKNCLIQAPPSIHPENEHDLIRWFAGWCTINSDVFRKFIVIGTGKSNAPQSRYLKKILPIKVNCDTKATKIKTTPQKPTAMNTSNETAPIQKFSEATLSDPASRAQTLDSLIEDARSANRINLSSPAMKLTSQELAGPSSTNNGHVVSDTNHERTSPPPLNFQADVTKSTEISGSDKLDHVGEKAKVNGLCTPIKNKDGCPVTQQAILKKWKEMKFEATSEWYRGLQARGDAWQHISVLEHPEVWKLVGFSRSG